MIKYEEYLDQKQKMKLKQSEGRQLWNRTAGFLTDLETYELIFPSSTYRESTQTISLWQSNPQNQSQIWNKTHIHEHQTNFLEALVSNLKKKKHIYIYKAWTCWYRRPFRLIYCYQIKNKKVI